MTFNITYGNICNRSLKNIHSSQHKTRTVVRTLDNPGRSSRYPHVYGNKPLSIFDIHKEYSSRYGAILPKAPAFREYSESKVRRIVERISKANRRTVDELEQREKEAREKRKRNSFVAVSPLARAVSFKLANKMTVASSIRRRLSEKNAHVYPDITLTCSRFLRSQSRMSYGYDAKYTPSTTIGGSDVTYSREQGEVFESKHHQEMSTDGKS